MEVKPKSKEKNTTLTPTLTATLSYSHPYNSGHKSAPNVTSPERSEECKARARNRTHTNNVYHDILATILQPARMNAGIRSYGEVQNTLTVEPGKTCIPNPLQQGTMQHSPSLGATQNTSPTASGAYFSFFRVVLESNPLGSVSRRHSVEY